MNEQELGPLKETIILFVDDEPHTRRAVERMLSSRCKEVWLAEHGQAAWEIIEGQTPDLVITDIEMPVMNGLQLLRKIKETYPDEPVVIMTAFEDEAHAAHDADAILIKPVHRQELFAALMNVLQSRGMYHG